VQILTTLKSDDGMNDSGRKNETNKLPVETLLTLMEESKVP